MRKFGFFMALCGLLGCTNSGKAVESENADTFTTTNGTKVRAYIIKHGSVRFQIGEKWLYVDPVTTAVPPVTDYKALPKADVILITHEHADHLDSEAISQLTKDGTLLITNPRSKELMNGKGEAMGNGETRQIDDMITIHAVPAYNISADKQQFHPKGRDNGYIIAVDNLKIYVAGDTENIDELKNLFNIDIAFLPCNLPFTMSPEQFAKAAKIVKPKVLFPYHYGKTDLKQVAHLLQDSGIELRIR